jgi:perosamine synthetase
MYKQTVEYIKHLYNQNDFIALHEPHFAGNEKKYINECIDSNFVSSVGEFVNTFEQKIAQYTGAKYAVATVNGTAALHIALILAGVGRGDEVITQPLTFVATANAISYTGARPIFIDVDRETLGLSPKKLEAFLAKNYTNKIKACIPMHTFGHPAKIDEIKAVCDRYNIVVVEDAAESLGSFFKNKHTGTFGDLGTLSFNGNKIITTGGGGMIITNNENLAKRAKHITTTAKIPHKWEYLHDETAYNYRLPNINAALGCAQMENLDDFVNKKRKLAQDYKEFFSNTGINFFTEPENACSNYWLNAIILQDRQQRDEFLEYTNNNGVMTRPAWCLMNKLDMYKNCLYDNIENAMWIEERLVNIPSGVKIC